MKYQKLLLAHGAFYKFERRANFMTNIYVMSMILNGYIRVFYRLIVFHNTR